MKITGKVEIQIRDADTLELKRTIKQDNLIPDASLLGINGGGFFNNSYFGNRLICISSSTEPPSRSRNTIPGILATGYIPSGVTSPRYFATATPPYGEIQNRIDPPAQDRIFNTVALADNSGANPRTVYAYLLLTTPCTQKTNEILDIFYRIQFLNTSGQGLTKKALVQFGNRLFDSTNFEPYILGSTPFSINQKSNYENLLSDESFMFCLNRSGGIGCAGGSWIGEAGGFFTIINSHFKMKWGRSFALDEKVGRIFNYVLHGRTSVNSWQKIRNDTAPFQSLFTHSLNATAPFLDSLKLATGNGIVGLSGSWEGKFPQLYKITITNDGAVGTAAYKWAVRSHLGFNGNTYNDRSELCIFRNLTIPAAAGMHGWREENNDVLRYSPTQIVQYDDTGVTLLDVVSSEYQNWDATTLPALPVTQVRQVAVDSINERIYVACRLTGLWVIDAVADTVTQIKNVGCYGVDIGRNAIAYALVDGGLYRSSDWSTPLAFTYAGISDNNWSKVYFLKVDPEHPDDRMALVMQPANANNRRVVWWNLAAKLAATGYEASALKPWAASLDVSDIGSFWATSIPGISSSLIKLFYGSASITNTGISLTGQQLNHSIWGSDRYFKIAFYKNFFIGQSQIVNDAGVTQNFYTNLGDNTFVLHLDGGIVLFNRSMRQLFTDNSYCWDIYGWDGSQWVLNGNGTKITHADEQLLGNGIKVKFADSPTAPQFKAGDFYTQGLCDGLWKDNAIASYYEFGFYLKTAIFDEPLSGVVPAAAPYQLYLNKAPLGSNPDPDWIRAETDQPSAHKILINGVAPLKLYVNGEVPAPNELTLDGATGKLTFNAFNAGATVSGIYSFIKN